MSKPQSIIEARAALESGALTPASLVKQTLENIDQWEESLNAFIETLPEEAQAQAAAARQPGVFAAGVSIARLRIALRNAPLGSNPGIRTIGSPNPATRVKGRYECGHGRRPAFSRTRAGSRHVGRGVARTWSPALRVPLVSRERGNGNRRPSIHRHTDRRRTFIPGTLRYTRKYP